MLDKNQVIKANTCSLEIIQEIILVSNVSVR